MVFTAVIFRNFLRHRINDLHHFVPPLRKSALFRKTATASMLGGVVATVTMTKLNKLQKEKS
jgi:hypothetical protein